MFIAALFTTAVIRKQPKCSSTDEWIKMRYLCTTEYYSTMKKKNNTICRNIDVTRDCHTNCSQSEREKQIPYDTTYMWNPKYDTNKSIKQNHEHREQTGGCQGERSEGRTGWEAGVGFKSHSIAQRTIFNIL